MPIYGEGDLFGEDITEEQFNELIADELRAAILDDNRWVVRYPNGGYTLFDPDCSEYSDGPEEEEAAAAEPVTA